MPFLPEEILVDGILARLPVKSLSRFKCVSKSWLSLIESDRFIEIHYRNSARNPRVMITHLKPRGGVNGGCSLQSLLESEEESDSDTAKNEQKVGVLLGCFNGLVCLFNFRRFLLWNPATRVSVELPPHNDEGCGRVVPVKSGFGWDESTGAHKVFVVLYAHENNMEKGILYSSSSNSWRTISPGCNSWSGRHGVFLRGNLHWVDGRRSQIECLDLETEEFGRIELMPSISLYGRVYNQWSRLGVIGGNLSILIILEKVFDVWVMKEYGVKDSWLKILTLPSASLCSPERGVISLLFGEGPNGEIFIVYGETLIIYNPKDDASFSFSTATTKVSIFEALVYVESLVSPKLASSKLLSTSKV